MYAVLQYHPRTKKYKLVRDTIRPDKKTAESMAKTLNDMVEPEHLRTVSVAQLYKIVKLRSKDLKTN